MARQSHLEHLASVPLFSACSKKELQAVARASDELDLPAGRFLCEQGAVGREAFIIVEGTAEVRRNNRKVATLTTGACVGELALLDHGPRTATAVCESDCTVLVVDRRNFLAIVESSHTLTSRLLEYMAARIRELDKSVYG
jgi:CRP-like cAMP-binding protein